MNCSATSPLITPQTLATIKPKLWGISLASNATAIATSAATRGGLAGVVAKGPTIVAGVADAVQATVEIVAAKQGKTKDQTRLIGLQTGAASSIALGWMVGGPVTAAAGVGIWFVGQMVADQVVDAGKEIVDAAVKQSDSQPEISDAESDEKDAS